MAVDKYKGLYHCFSPSCDASGKLEDLPRVLLKMNHFQVQRLLIQSKSDKSVPFTDRLAEAMAKPVDFEPFPQEVLNRAVSDFKGSIAQDYMHSRGFTDETLEYFGVGYSKAQGMVIVPMHDPKGMPIGLIGRTPSHENKRFKNSTNLPKSKTCWNFHRAKRTGDTVIVCEASYDAMRIHQAGYPNVVALLGGHVTPHHVEQLGRTFSTVVIMTDFDELQYRPNCKRCKNVDFRRGDVRCLGHRPGRDLGDAIASQLSHKKILWAAYGEEEVFPHGAKDASDMTDDEIRQCLKNAVSRAQYSMWEL